VFLSSCGTPVQRWGKELFHPGEGDDDSGPDLSVLYGTYDGTGGRFTVQNSGVSNGNGADATLAAGTLTISGGTVATPKVETITLAFAYDSTVSGSGQSVVTISKDGAVIGFIICTMLFGNYATGMLYLGPAAEGSRSVTNTGFGGTALSAISYTDIDGAGMYY
jgi:hypothetical protein